MPTNNIKIKLIPKKAAFVLFYFPKLDFSK